MIEEFREWTAVAPGIISLSHTQYQIKHETVAEHSFLNVYWEGRCVGRGYSTLEGAKQRAFEHMNDMLQMGYEV